MGQCSTMPDHHGGGGAGGEPTSPQAYYHHSRHQHPPQSHHQHHRSPTPRQQRDDYVDHRRASECTGRNPNNNEHNNMYMEEDLGHSSVEDPKTPLMRDASRNNTANMTSFLNVVRHSVNVLDPFMNNDGKSNNMQPPSTAPGYAMRNTRVHPSSEPQQDAMMHNIRQQPPPPSPSVSIPPNSVRMRCYRLNLESNMYIQSNNIVDNNITTYGSDDECSEVSTRKIAISTAKIFRGITVSRDGTVSSRKMRSNNSASNKSKAGEKSRQAAKIDKAKDLVEQCARSGKGASLEGKSTDDDPSNMVSLFIMGEYDDIKHLVRDGSKKLKDAEGLPDESLLAINRPRCSNDGSRQQQGGPFYSQDAYQQAPSSSRSKYQQRSSSRSSRVNNSVPPRLKGHPRDTIPSRYHASTPTANSASSNRHSSSQHHQSSRGTSSGNPTIATGTNNNAKFPNVPHQCSEFNIFGGGDSDWSEALNFSKGFNSLWNCGASGAEVGGEGHHHNPHHQYERESGSRQTRRVRSYSNEEFRAMKQQQQSRYNNAVVNLEGREDMVIDQQQQPPQHGCFGATSTKHSSRYSHHSSMNYGSSASHHHNTNSRASATSASNRSSAGNDVILV